MSRADSASVLIPPGSPLAVGWRADAAALLIRHGLAEMMEVLTAFAELCRRQEPTRRAILSAALKHWT